MGVSRFSSVDFRSRLDPKRSNVIDSSQGRTEFGLRS